MRFFFISSEIGDAVLAKNKFIKIYGQNNVKNCDVIVPIGGDGFLLKSLHDFNQYNKPFYGINYGSIGFLMNNANGESLEKIILSSRIKIKREWIYELSKKIILTPSLYIEAGAIHGCVLCKKNEPIIYMEDVGRHNAVDKIAGYIFVNKIKAHDKIFYTTGRLTSEMIIKTVKMGIPILISRSGFTSWGVELAKKTNLTLIGRAKGKRYMILSGEQRLSD